MKRGEVITSREGIANIFGDFYSRLFADDQCEETELKVDKNETETDKRDQCAGLGRDRRNSRVHNRRIAGCQRESKRQQRNQSQRHQNMRRRDKRNGEADLQRSDKTKRLHTRGMLKNSIKVMYKEGDLEDAGNYLLICCTLPPLYRLFSTLLNNRLYSRLDW